MRWATQDDEIEEGDTLKLAVAGALDAGTYTVRFDNGSGSVYAIEVAVSEGATYIFVDTGDLGDDAGSGSYDIDVVDDSGSSLLDSGAASVNISQRLYLHYGLHSPVVATNSDGETVWRRAYLPFGADFSGSPSHPLTIANSSITHGFVGRRQDNDVGLYQLGARWYDPDLGRFVSTDPVSGLLNQYSYANNNPFVYHDASGLFFEQFTTGVVKQALSPWIKINEVVKVPGLDTAMYYIEGTESEILAWEDTHDFFTGTAHEDWWAMADTYEQGSAGYWAYGVGGMFACTNDIQFFGSIAELGAMGLGAKAVAGEEMAAANAGKSSKASQLSKNKAKGDAFRDEIAELFEKNGYEVEKEVTKKTPFGNRRLDMEVKKDGKVLGGIETKTGDSPYKPSQRAKDKWLQIFERYFVDLVRDN